MKTSRLLFSSVAALSLLGTSACVTDPNTGEKKVSRTAIGGVGGAVVGGLLGGVIGGKTARIVGAVAGGAVGDRKSVVEGKSVSVRVDLGGRSIIKKKKEHKSITTEN